jgi:hypothetical protein
VIRAGTYAIRIYTRATIATIVAALRCGACVMVKLGNDNAQLMALCMACGRKATLSVYSRILEVELTICKGCALKNKGAANE